MDDDARSADELVEDYLASLAREAERLEPVTRQELLDDVRSHIEVALAEAENPDRVEAARILGALGEPREIVDAALADTPSAASPSAVSPSADVSAVPAPAPTSWDPGASYPLGGREVAAIMLLLAGVFLVGLGWLAGLWLLWTSPRWSTRAKLIGTLVLPGGLAPLAFAAGMTSSSSSCTSSGDAAPVCVHHGVSLSAWPAALLAVLLVVLPLVTSVYLWRRASATRPALPATGGGLAAVSVGVAVVFGVLVAGCGAFLIAGVSSTEHGGTAVVPEVSQEAPVASSLP